jgi:hypothetical protein
MRIELYTVNQLLAMHARVGGGVVQAVQRVVDRGNGAVVEELAEVLRMHRSGRRITDALEHAARTTPEPNAARTYKLLANGVEYGADLAEGLRALSEDIRDQRVEAMKRAATKRRAAMLVPIIAVLAPVMLLFIAAHRCPPSSSDARGAVRAALDEGVRAAALADADGGHCEARARAVLDDLLGGPLGDGVGPVRCTVSSDGRLVTAAASARLPAWVPGVRDAVFEARASAVREVAP